MNPHIVDLSTESGLINLMYVGNIIQLRQFLDRRKTIAVLEEAEEVVAVQRCQALQKWFCKNYRVHINGRYIQPQSIFIRSLMEFGASIVTYSKEIQDQKQASVKKKDIIAFFQKNFPDTIDTFTGLIMDNLPMFRWDGGPLSIVPRVDNFHREEHRDFIDMEIYNQDSDSTVSPGPESEDESSGSDYHAFKSK